MNNLERLQKESELTVLETRLVGQRLRAEKLRDTLRLLLDLLHHRVFLASLPRDFVDAHRQHRIVAAIRSR